MTTIAIIPPPPALQATSIIPGWRWRTHGDGEVAPSSMATTHLFFTLRMIWNHGMPTHMHVGGRTRQWRFGARHNPQYMRQAIVQIGAELFTRTDLPASYRAQLDEMARWFQLVSAESFVTDARALMLPDQQVTR